MLCCGRRLVAHFVSEKFLMASPSCAKLADMLLTKRTYTYLGGVSPLSRPEPSCASVAFPRDAFPQQPSRYNRIESFEAQRSLGSFAFWGGRRSSCAFK